MVATLVRLKVRILRHTLGREVWRLVLLVIGILWALSMMPSVIGGSLWLSHQGHGAARDIVVVAGSLAVAGWTFIPILVPGMDDSLDIGRFATSGLRARRLAPGLLVAGLVSVPAVFTGILALAPVLAWHRVGGPTVALAVAAAPVALLTCVLHARVCTELASRLLSSRRSRETGTVIGLLAAVLAVPAVLALGSLGLEGALEKVPTIAQVLGWTPFGLAWAAPSAMAVGDAPGAYARLALAVVWVVVLAVGWTVLLQRALVQPPSHSGQARRRSDAMLPRSATRRHPGLVAAVAIARRGLRSWTADPRYMGALLGAVVAPVLIVMLGAAVVEAPDVVVLGLGGFMAGTIGWGRHNDLAYDGSAFWLHLTAHVPGWADRLGRTLSTFVWAAPVVVTVSLIGAMVVDRWDLAGAAVGLGVGVLCGGLAVSAVASALLPYPVPEAGANPYAAQMGAVGATLVAQLVSSMATMVVCAPVAALYALSLWLQPGLAVATLLVGVVGGLATLAAGVILGGRVYDGRASRLLVRLG